jgi:O-antigen/teichoic acid export membrane protein
LTPGAAGSVLPPQSVADRLRGLIASRFLRDGALLASGSLVSQVFTLACAPIMARLYEPSAYGLLGLFIAVYGLVTVPATLQYEQAVLLPRDDADALALLKGGLLLGSITLMILVGALLLPIPVLLADSKYAVLIPWLPLVVALVLPGVINTFSYSWLARKQKYRLLSLSRVVTNLSSTLVALSLGFVGGWSWGLLAGNAVGMVLGSAILLYGLGATGGLACLRVSWADVRSQLKQFRRFPMFSTPTQFVSQYLRQLPVLILTAVAGPATVGYFNMSNRLLGLPNSLFVESLSQVFLQRAARQYSQAGDCRAMYRKMLQGMLLVTIPSVAVLAAIAPELFAFVLGERWRPAGDYSRLLCWLIMFRTICTPLAAMLTIAQRQAEDLLVQLAGIVLVGLSMWLSYVWFGSDLAMIAAYSLSYSVVYAYYAVRGYRLAGAV